MKKLAEPGVYEKLKALAGGRVYAILAPQNVQTPFIVFNRISSDRWRSFDGPDNIAQARIQVDCYGSDYYESKELAADVEGILDGFVGNIPYGSNSPQDFVKFSGVSLENDIDFLEQTVEPFLYRNSMSFLITYEQ